jgi:hypothetical protein
MRAKPCEVAAEARQLIQQDTEPLRARRGLQSEELFYREDIAETIGQRAQVINALGERECLVVSNVFAGFLDSGVQVSDLGSRFDDRLAIHLQDQA